MIIFSGPLHFITLLVLVGAVVGLIGHEIKTGEWKQMLPHDTRCWLEGEEDEN